MEHPAQPSVARHLFELFQAREWDAAAELVAPDAVFEWPHSTERFRGRANIIAVNRAYPEPWEITVRRVTIAGTTEVVEADVRHPGGVATVASVCEVHDGLITHAREYWVEVGAEEPPEDRAQWSERMPRPEPLRT